jgi:hypothetical protein
MSAAEWVEVTFAGLPALMVRDGVIVVAADGGSPAAGVAAPGAADLDDVPELRGRLVSS